MDMNETLEVEKDNLRKYLLQELAEAEQEEIELRLLTDSEFSRHLAMAQDELLDDFATARLSEHEEERFREHYLVTPERKQRLNFATALDRYVMAKTSGKAGVFEKLQTLVFAKPFKTAFALVGLLLLFGAGLFTVWRIQSRQQRDLLQEFARVNRPDETDSIPYSVLKQDSGNTVVLTLRENIVRENGDSRSVEITAGVTLVRLLLEVGAGSYSTFNARLQTDQGKELASVENLKARDAEGAPFVVINVPSEFLTSGDYQLTLIGISSDGRATDLGPYPFHVVIR